MPSKNMLPKGARRVSVRKAYRAQRFAEPEAEVVIPVLEDEDGEDGIRTFMVDALGAGMRLDIYLAKALPDISRGRVQMLIENEQVLLDGEVAKAKTKLKGGEQVEIEGEPRPEPLHATAEPMDLAIVYEDDDLAVIDKPAGMMVHAGAGTTDEARNSGTLVNGLLHHFQSLSEVGGDLRPGIVHRLDKQTSGLIIVAKNDSTHRKLGEMFAIRALRKTYIALVHGFVTKDSGTINLAVSRDRIRRTRMTTKGMGGRSAISHYQVLERIDGPYGKFTLVEVRIETGRTHQIRVHMQALGHSVVGDNLYGAPHLFGAKDATSTEKIGLERNFLHAARLGFAHPQTGKAMELEAELPAELQELLAKVRGVKEAKKVKEVAAKTEKASPKIVKAKAGR